MTRVMKLLIGVSMVAAMALGVAGSALGLPTLTLAPTRTTVTYPQPTWLKLVSADGTASVGTTVTIQYRPIGSDTWKRLRTITASRTAEGTVTVPVSPRLLKSITGFRAIAEGLESDVTTVSVKARLSTATTRATIRSGRHITVKGFIWPRHAFGSRPVEVTVWKWDGTAWVEKGTLHPKIVGHTLYASKWQFTSWVGADDKGRWRMQVSHEDLQHAASTSRYSYIRVR